ncbi:MAG TPA: dephospho-CoA kinase [Chloroflexi bacterium]|nr:dephospho-CoA kinase [Chloroflexota bacterium]
MEIRHRGAPVSEWEGTYVIGLTGNIGTGKSVVRRMLEQLGAYGIDADVLSHRVTARNGPAYQPIVETFGSQVLREDGEIDRARLGKLVFSDPEKLSVLESIVHPLVRQAIDAEVSTASRPVVVLEAIKLLETSLRKQCDSLWVVYASPEVQLRRLVESRGMDEQDARQRIQAQPPQEEKVAAADVVIDNSGSVNQTMEQVTRAWNRLVPVPAENLNRRFSL